MSSRRTLHREFRGGYPWLLAPCLLAAIAPAQTARVTVDWHVEPEVELPAGVRSIMVQELRYDGLDRSVVDDARRAAYRQLVRALQREIAARGSGLRILDKEKQGMREMERSDRAARGERDLTREHGADAFVVPHLSCSKRDVVDVKQREAGTVVLERYLRGASGGLTGGGADRERVVKRVIEVRADMDFMLRSGETLLPFECVEVDADTTSAGGLFGADGRVLTDFEPEAEVVGRMVDRIAAEFATRLLGFRGPRTFEMPGASSGCRAAASHYMAGSYEQAALAGARAFARDRADHQACFVTALAAEAGGNRTRARKWHRKAIEIATQCKADARDYRAALGRLESEVRRPVRSPAPHAAQPEPASAGVAARRPPALAAAAGTPLRWSVPSDLRVALRSAVSERRETEPGFDEAALIERAVRAWLAQREDPGTR